MNIYITIPSAFIGIYLFRIVLYNPEKVQIWSSIIWKMLNGCGSIIKIASKNYIKYDLQGRVNDFTRKLDKEVPGISKDKLRIEWVEENIDRKTIIDNGTVILRLRRNDPKDHNFVHGTYLFVSTILLNKTKRYLSMDQKEAIDLFICSKLFENEKRNVKGYFLDEYLHPKTTNTNPELNTLLDDFAIIDSGKYFNPVFMQELYYLGNKVFGRRIDMTIAEEVNKMVEFIKPIATRSIGELNDNEFDGSFFRFAIVIVGKAQKVLSSIEPYITYIERGLLPKNVETIYLVSRAIYDDQVQQICRVFFKHYSCEKTLRFKRKLYIKGNEIEEPTYLVVLRKYGIPIIRPSK